MICINSNTNPVCGDKSDESDEKEKRGIYLIRSDTFSALGEIKRCLKDYNDSKDKTAPCVYLFNNELTFYDKNTDEKGNKENRLIPIDRALLRTLLTEFGTWVTPASLSCKDEYPKSRDVPNTYLDSTISTASTHFKADIPVLNGITDGCLLTPEYDIVHTKGYNKPTRFILTNSYDVRDVPDVVTEADVAEVKAMLWDIFKEFRFSDSDEKENSVHYQNTIAALYTAMIRPVWSGVLPVWVVTKTSERTGGTLLQETVFTLASGSVPKQHRFTANPEEHDKQIISIINTRERFGLIDNVTPGGEWVTPTLLTATGGNGVVSYRKFHTQETVTRTAETFFAINGKNIEISADVCGRVFVTKIMSQKNWQAERWERTDTELLELAAMKHAEAVRSFVVLRRFWEQRGRPAPLPCTGNISQYADWYFEICGMLCAAGFCRVLSNLGEVQTSENSEDEEGAAFVNALYAEFKDREFSAAEFASVVNEEGYARRHQQGGAEVFLRFLNDKQTAAASRFELGSKSLGRLLTKYAEKPFSRCEFVLRRCRGREGINYKITPRVEQKKLL